MSSNSIPLQTATFALGWFWFPEAAFGCAKGVVRTRVGYCGGRHKDPTYHNLGDHTETIQLDYDSTITTYENLLTIFWNSHSGTSMSSKQYRSAIYYHGPEQYKAAALSKEYRQNELGKSKKITTAIEPYERFYVAEDYHQKFELRHKGTLFEKLGLTTFEEVVNSIIAARLNGYVMGYGTLAQLKEELKEFKLSPSAEAEIINIVSAFDVRGSAMTCGDE